MEAKMYEVRYLLDNNQRVVKSKIAFGNGEAWTIDYVYNPILVRASIIKPDGNVFG